MNATECKPRTIEVDGETYVRREDVTGDDVRILIGQRGFVWVGYYSVDGEQVTLRDAACIRRWGTTKGLGELRDGPTSETTLDPCGTVECHVLAVIATIRCDASKWAGVLCR